MQQVSCTYFVSFSQPCLRADRADPCGPPKIRADRADYPHRTARPKNAVRCVRCGRADVKPGPHDSCGFFLRQNHPKKPPKIRTTHADYPHRTARPKNTVRCVRCGPRGGRAAARMQGWFHSIHSLLFLLKRLASKYFSILLRIFCLFLFPFFIINKNKRIINIFNACNFFLLFLSLSFSFLFVFYIKIFFLFSFCFFSFLSSFHPLYY